MKEIVLYRNNYVQNQILGHLMVVENLPSKASRLIFECKTLELDWNNNEKNISATPTGYYNLRYEYSGRFKRKLWELKGVPNRSECKIHVANFSSQLQGCIGVGDMFTHLNGDSHLDLRNSSNTLNRLHEIMKNQTESTIRIFGKN